MKQPKLSYVACCTLLALGTSVASHQASARTNSAQTNYAQANTQTSAATTSTYQLNLEAQATSDALLALAEQTNTQIIFSPEVTRGKSSRSVQGSLSVEQALNNVLQGTGLTFEQQGAATYVIKTQTNTSRVQQNFREQLGNADDENSATNVERIQVVGSNIRGARAAA